MHEPIGLSSITTIQKQIFFTFCIELTPLFIRHNCVDDATKYIHVYNARPPSASCFFGRNGIQRPY